MSKISEFNSYSKKPSLSQNIESTSQIKEDFLINQSFTQKKITADLNCDDIMNKTYFDSSSINLASDIFRNDKNDSKKIPKTKKNYKLSGVKHFSKCTLDLINSLKFESKAKEDHE